MLRDHTHRRHLRGRIAETAFCNGLLEALSDVKSKHDIMIVSDIHEAWQAKYVAQVVDMLQIPALLSRQTDLICAAAETGKLLNIKKSQSMSPFEMKNAVEKARITSRESGYGDGKIFVTERGTFFGYNNLVVDMRNFHVMSDCTGCPVIFDASHSVQLPCSLGDVSGGQNEFITELACAAISTGKVSGIYFETHPNPESALCDAPILLPFAEIFSLVSKLKYIYQGVCSR
jgi:2-dehydro-3-deoxyphosphooctonate aldolase (KDO 8-P synthase)